MKVTRIAHLTAKARLVDLFAMSESQMGIAAVVGAVAIVVGAGLGAGVPELPMQTTEWALRSLLWAHVGYFCCMHLAHWWGYKKPVLFVYYDVPFFAYQDKIISFCVLTYIALFTSAATSTNLEAVPFALVSIWTTVGGLSCINSSDALQDALRQLPKKGKVHPGTKWYWAQTAMIAAGAAAMTGLYIVARPRGI